MDEFDIGELGNIDAASMAFDIPMPNEADQATFEAAQSISAAGFSLAVTPDMAASAPASMAPVDVGMADSIDMPMAPEGFSAELGEIPQVTPQIPDPVGANYSDEGGGYESPAAFTIAAPAPASDAPTAASGEASMLGGLPSINLPMNPEAPFAGVSLPPEEAFDLSLVAPPAPSQEGFPSASDAPMSMPVGAYASLSSDFQSIGHLRDMEMRSTQIFGPLASEASSRAGGGSGGGVHIEHLHLPSARGVDFVNDLLSQSTGTEADLSGLVG